jgi:hypothetical protein
MKGNKPMKTITNIIYLAFACFGLSPQARAVCQEGCLTNFNTVLGDDALLNNTGSYNTAIGFKALYGNTTGNENTAIGDSALASNTTGVGNTATGVSALQRNTTGINNLAGGYQALFSNTIGTGNAATGAYALYNNTSGSYNTASGVKALNSNSAGIHNTADGNRALYSNTIGGDNTAIGIDSLYSNVTGAKNIALGSKAGFSLTTGSNNIDIGNEGVAAESGRIRLGTKGKQTSTYIAGISGVVVAGGVGVIVDSNGQLGTVVSSARYKDAIKPMDRASEAILALQPVTFRYKHELDPDGIPQFGLVAEQVEKVNPDLVARDEQGKPYTVRYEAVNAMLLNEFLKEHRKVADQGDQIAELQATVAELKSAFKAQAAKIQKVNDQLRTQAPRVVAND